MVDKRTRRLTPDAPATVDRKISRVAATLPFGRLVKVLDAAMLAADPPQAKTDTEAAASECGVWLGPADVIEAGIDRRRCVFGPATLYVHISHQTLDAAAGVARVEDIGPALATQVQQWLGHRDVTVKPVLDPAAIPPVDCYEIPDTMTEALRLAKPADCFLHSPNITANKGTTDRQLHREPEPTGSR